MAIPQIRVAFPVPFPTRVVGAGPIEITKLNGVWTVALDFGQLVEHMPLPVDYPSTFLLTYNLASGLYEKVTIEDLQSMTQTGLEVALGYIMDGGGQDVPSGAYGYETIPGPAQLTEFKVLLDALGSIEVDVLSCAKADYDPPTHPALADCITPVAKPTITNGKSLSITDFTGWPKTTFAKDDVFRFVINSVSAGVQFVTIVLNLSRLPS